MRVFRGQYLSGYLDCQIDEVKGVVQTAHDDQLMGANKDSYVTSLISQYSVRKLQLHFEREEFSRDQRQATENELSSVDMTFGRRFDQRYAHSPDAVNVLTYHLPFSGDIQTLNYDPKYSNRLSLPKLKINKNEISFEVVMNESMPEQSVTSIQNYKQWLKEQVDYINTDLDSYNASLPDVVQQLVNAEALARSKVMGVLTNFALPMRKMRGVEEGKSTFSMPTPTCNKYYSVGISFGGTNEPIAAELNSFLTNLGIKTFFFPVHAVLGEKLHRTMFQLANDHDKVLLICSKESLSRNGVLYEIEQVLEREASLGGATTILIPVRLDDYVLKEWAPERPDIASQIRNRVIGKLSEKDLIDGGSSAQLQQIVTALTKK